MIVSGRIDPRYRVALWRVPLEVVTDEMALNVPQAGWLIISSQNPRIGEWGVSVTHEMLHRVHDLHESVHGKQCEDWIEAKAKALMRNPRWAAEVWRRIAYVCARRIVLSP